MWRFAVTGLGLTLLVLGLGATTGGTPGIVVAAVLAAGGSWVCWRSVRMRLEWDDHGVRHVGFARTRTLTWSQVETVTSEMVDSKIVFDVVSAVFRLADSSELVSYATARFANPVTDRNRRTDRVVARLDDALARSRGEGGPPTG